MNEELMVSKKNIVILGGGFGGVTCALRLNKLMKRRPALLKDFNLVLIDKKNYHLYTPALYEVASAMADDGAPLNLKKTVATPMEEIARGTAIKFIQSAAVKIDPQKKEICFSDDAAIEYEHLVLALGSEPAYFGIPGLKEHSIPLKSFENAIHIRGTIRRKYEQKQNGETINIIVGGAGPTGVELSAELIGYIKRLDQKLRKDITPRVVLIEGSTDILPGFSVKVVSKARAHLIKNGVVIKSSSLMLEANDHSVRVKPAKQANLDDAETMAYDALVWTGGVEACALTRTINLREEKRGRMETDAYLQCLSPNQYLDVAENIYAIGDNACFYNPKTKMPASGTARVAIEQAKVAAENIYRKITGQKKIEYKLKNYPFAIPLGGKYAITQIGPMIFIGLSGWILKQLIELYYLFSITDDIKAFARWCHGLGIFSKND